jgi:type IV pilus assembly protein PilP
VMGCTTTGEDEIKKWMGEEKGRIRPQVKPISPPKQFKPETYANADKPDPFSNQKLTQALRNEVAQTNVHNNSALVEPELARRKEPLEAVPLDTMSLVGNITQAGRLVALVKVDNFLYQIKLGAYLGQNYGKVMKITETEVTLREIVQDAAGTWIERVQTLSLQERGK